LRTSGVVIGGALAGCLGGGDDSDTEAAVTCSNEDIHETYAKTQVTVTDDDTKLGTVTAAVADTPSTRFTGLSDTACLPADRGMLFVYDNTGSRAFVMREMSFSIDIVYVSPERRITSIHHAEQPADGESGTEPKHTYQGEGQYILEVPYKWTARRNVSTGDRVRFEL
jgi:uncharacterized membrane protein (UPF0127 family)